MESVKDQGPSNWREVGMAGRTGRNWVPVGKIYQDVRGHSDRDGWKSTQVNRLTGPPFSERGRRKK